MTTIEYIYIDESTWNPYPIGGIVEPRTTFIIKATKVVGSDTFVKTKTVYVCKDKYQPYVSFNVVNNGSVKSYVPVLVGIPVDQIESLTWTVTEDGDPVTYQEEPKEVAANTVVCASVEVQLICGCDTFVVSQACHSFDSLTTCEGEIGINVVEEDGCYRPERTSTMNPDLCIAIDMIMYRTNETDPWNIMGERESVCAQNIWFKRVVTFCGDVCETKTFEIEVVQ